MKYYFETADFDTQLARSLAKTTYGCAEIGECMAVAEAITEGDCNSWFIAWNEMAQRLENEAREAVDKGKYETARGNFMRASEYYRSAFFFDREDLANQRLQTSYASHVRCFRAALPLFEFAAEIVEIPFEGSSLGGYLLAPDDSGQVRPTVVAPGGYDSTAEEGFPTAVMGISRGFNVLIFDGPGQGGTLFDRHVPMRPDYESVSPAVNDFVLARADTDNHALAWLGRSFGGLLVPRAVSGDSRITAMIVDPGQYDIFAAVSAKFPAEMLAKLDDSSTASRQTFEDLLQIPHLRQLFAPRMTTHGVDSVWDYLRALRDFNCRDQASTISCPSLVCDNEIDPVSTGQGLQLFDALTCPKDFHRFTAAEGSGGHCEGTGQIRFYELAFDWLSATFSQG